MDVLWPWATMVAGVIFLFMLRLRSRSLGRYRTADSKDDKGLAGGQISSVNTIRSLMPVFVSLIVLGSALLIILGANYPEAQQKWAFGAVGTILGYWLKA